MGLFDFMSFLTIFKNKLTLILSGFVLLGVLYTGFYFNTRSNPQTSDNTQFISKIEANKDYSFGKINSGKINFSNLPSADQNLEISGLSLNRAGKNYDGYEFKTTLRNGSFNYDLELPNQYGTQAKLVYSQDDGKTFWSIKMSNFWTVKSEV